MNLYNEFDHESLRLYDSVGVNNEIITSYIEIINKLSNQMELQETSQIIQLMEDLAMMKPELMLRPLVFL